MPAKLLVLVHGMGVHPPDWSSSLVERLDSLSANYQAFKTKRFSKHIAIAELAYDDCFSKVVDDWQTSSAGFGAWATQAGRPMPKVVSWLDRTLPASESAAKSFFWSTAIDPLLYRGFALVRDRVRATVAARLVEIIADATEDEAVDVTICAHSLGTAVMHDVLDQLANGRVPPEVADVEVLRTPPWRFANLFMIADVCQLGPAWVRDIDALNSVVRPVAPDGSVAGNCDRFFEVWHRYDPFVLCGPFRPTEWGDGYRPIGPLAHFRGANVHGYTHYLDHPRVHIPLFNAAMGRTVIKAQEQEAAIAGYGEILSPECSQQIEALKAKAKEFEAVRDDLELLVIKAAEFYAVAKQAAEQCNGLRHALDLP